MGKADYVLTVGRDEKNGYCIVKERKGSRKKEKYNPQYLRSTQRRWFLIKDELVKRSNLLLPPLAILHDHSQNT